MAYIEKTAFEARITNGHNDDLQGVTGRFQTDGTDDTCSAGMLCVRAGALPCAGYEGYGVLNENAWYMNAAPATVNAGDVIYACNTYDWNLITDPVTKQSYAVGAATLGLPIPAGRIGTFTRIDFNGDCRYRFGIGNVSGTVGENKYFTIKDGLLVPAASAPTAAGALYFELAGTGNFTVGVTSSFEYVDVLAKRVQAAA